MAETQPTVHGYYPSLDGLRGIAIILVLFYHLFDFVPGSRFCFVGVDLFFVLSGFLITSQLLERRGNFRWIPHFYLRRALRIFPVYFASLILFLYILPRLLPGYLSAGYLLRHQLWLWTEIQNWLFIFYPAGNPNWLTHFWTLAVEEQFYLLVPWLVCLVASQKKLLTVIGFIFFGQIALRLLLWHLDIPGMSYQMLFSFTRIDGLCAGSALAVLRLASEQDKRRTLIVVCVIFSIFLIIMACCRLFIHLALPYTATCIYPLTAFGFAWLVSVAKQDTGWTEWALARKSLIFAGRISYSWYIFHWPVFYIITRWASDGAGQGSGSWNPWFASLLSVICSALLATLSFYFFEKRCLALKRFFP